MLISKGKVIRLPTFESTKAPWGIESKRQDGENHNEQPIPKKPKASPVKGQGSALDKGKLGNPTLLSRVGPWEKETEGDNGQHPGPNK